MKANEFKVFADAAVQVVEKITGALEQQRREEINSALALGASAVISFAVDARGFSTIRLEVVTDGSRVCVASLAGSPATIQ